MLRRRLLTERDGRFYWKQRGEGNADYTKVDYDNNNNKKGKCIVLKPNERQEINKREEEGGHTQEDTY